MVRIVSQVKREVKDKVSHKKLILDAMKIRGWKAAEYIDLCIKSKGYELFPDRDLFKDQ
jgi:hypothetical protein